MCSVHLLSTKCVQVRGVCDSRQGALHTKTLIHHILGPNQSGFEPELDFSGRQPKKSSGSGFGSKTQMKTRLFPLFLGKKKNWKKKLPKHPHIQGMSWAESVGWAGPRIFDNVMERAGPGRSFENVMGPAGFFSNVMGRADNFQNVLGPAGPRPII